MSVQDTKLKFPYKIIDFDPTSIMKTNKNSAAHLWFQIFSEKKYVQVGPTKWFLPESYRKIAEEIYNLELRSDDVFVVTLPRSGTTWTQEMIWLLCNSLDFDKAAKFFLDDRFPWLEKEKKNSEKIEDTALYKIINLKDRRFIQTHLPFSLLPPNLTKIGCKVIYIARNPKDVAVSCYHFRRSLRKLNLPRNITFSEYWPLFRDNLQMFLPFWEHIKEGWERRNEKNVFFQFYENINQNLRDHLEKLSQFLCKSYSSDQLDRLENHLKFENFKNNKSVNKEEKRNEDNGSLLMSEAPFIRKGKIGGWKDYFDEEMNQNADAWIKANLRNIDIKFPVSL